MKEWSESESINKLLHILIRMYTVNFITSNAVKS